MLEKLNRLSLKTKIATFTVAMFIVAIWMLAHDLDVEVRDDFHKVLAAQQFQLVEHIANTLDEAIDLRIRSLEDAALMVQPAWMQKPEHLKTFLADRKPLFNLFSGGVVIVSSEGAGLADFPVVEGRVGGDFSGRDFVRIALSTGKPAIGKARVGAFSKVPLLPIAVPIKAADGKIVGIMIGTNKLLESDLFGEMSPSHSQSSGDIHVISRRDQIVVASTDAKRVLQPAPAPGSSEVFDRYRKGFEGSGVAVDSQGLENLTAAKQIPRADWVVIGTLPTAVAFDPITSLRQEIYEDAAMASVIIALLLWLFLHRQLAPLSHASKALQEMTSGEQPLRPLPLEGGGEVRDLLESFNQLQQHISHQKQALRDNAERLLLAASVFDGSSEAILISDAENRILTVNKAFCEMTGYDEADLIGNNPRLLQSGMHDAEFYAAMWDSLKSKGRWQGEIWNKRKNGEIYPERLSVSIVRDEAGNVLRHIAIAANIAAQKEAEAEIWHLANYQTLTRLPNRRLLMDRLAQEIKKARRDGVSIAVLQIDLDRFMEINNTLGHRIGDQVLVEVAARVSSCVRTSDTVAHLGADEFVVVLGGVAGSPAFEKTARAILEAIEQPMHLGSDTVYITASMGITLYPQDADDIDVLLQNADQAKYIAKNEGRNCFSYFTESMQSAAQLRMQLANDLRGALAARQLEVYYQPILELASGRVAKAEALLRWRHPERGMVSPADFIPIAEETGLITEIGDWVFREAAGMAKHWCNSCEFMTSGACTRPQIAGSDANCLFQIGINKSPRQFFTGNTHETWIDYLRELDISPQCVNIEITEGLLLDQHQEVTQKLLQFSAAGIQVSLDDFGTGYSAMSYLKKFDIDYIKIDQSFVRDMTEDSSDLAIVEAVIVMAHKLGMKVVAEGVETPAQRDLLAAAGCDYGQGYLFARPMPADQFKEFIRPGA